MEAALRKEIQHRRRVGKVARQQYQALAATLRLALEQPSLNDFTPALLKTIVRECNAVWVTLWHVDEAVDGARRVASAYQSQQIGQMVESFARLRRKDLTKLSRLYRSLSLDTRSTTIVKADDSRVAPSIRRFYQQVNVASVLVVPMLWGEQLVGWIACLCGEPHHRIEADRVAFLETITHEATLVAHLTELAERTREIERIRESERLTREREREAIFIGRLLHTSVGGLKEGAGIDHLLAGIVQNACQLLEGHACGVWIERPDGRSEAFSLNHDKALVSVLPGEKGREEWERLRRLTRGWPQGRELVSKKIRSSRLEELLQIVCGTCDPLSGRFTVTLPMLLRERCLGWVVVVTAALPLNGSERWLAARALALQAALVLELDTLISAERRRVLAEERQRMARDMHDVLAQAFSSIMLQTEALRAERGELPAPVLSRLEKIQFLASRGIDEVRSAMSIYRPALLDRHSLSEALAMLSTEIWTSLGITVQCVSRFGSASLDSKVELHLFAIASEAIHNSIRHAQATLIEVFLEPSRSGGLQLRIRDNGTGFVRRSTAGLDETHFGIRNMRERARAIGAKFFLTSVARRGTTIRVLLPRANAVPA